MKERLIVALDTSEKLKTKKLVEELDDTVEIFKVGLEQYLASRGEVLDYLNAMDKKIFLDLKFHDIPNTMAAAARMAVKEDVWMFNIHVTAPQGMRRVVEAVKEESQKKGSKRPLITAVTVLTSIDENDLNELGIMLSPEEAVTKRALLAKEAGIDGVVSSSREVENIKSICGTNFITVCPGIRPSWASKGDQKRTLTPGEAIKKGADYLVIGRPITRSDRPREAAIRILKEMEEAE